MSVGEGQENLQEEHNLSDSIEVNGYKHSYNSSKDYDQDRDIDDNGRINTR